MNIIQRTFPTVVAASLALAPLTTYAAPDSGAAAPDDDSDEARGLELFANGRRLFDEGSYEPAALAFEEAYELLKEPNLLFNIHLCYERLGNYDKAISVLDKYRALAPADETDGLTRRREALVKRKEKEAQEEAARLAEEKAAAERAAKEKAEAETGEDEGDTPRTDPDEGDKPRAPKRIFGPLAITGTVIAVVGGGVGLGLALVTRSKKQSALDSCTGSNNLCLESFDSDASATRGLAAGANAGFAIGGAGAIVAIVAIAVNASRKRQASSAKVQPTFRLTRNGGGLGLAGRF